MADKPTPKEIDDLVYELRQAGKDDTYSLASAVLAKWGTPATGGEPAGTVGYTVHGTQYVNWRTKPPAHGTPLYTTPQPTQAQAAEPFCWHWENTFNGGTGTVKKNPETLGINMSHPDYKWTALYTAQPPTHAQAGAVPLTGGQIKGLIEDGVFFGNCKEIVRAIEAAHGITQKGGQHGTE